jgi:hypothetical protein
MYIRKIVLENIRCFGEGERRVELDLQRPDGSYAGWTVLAGRNGSGKSTFLRAVALAMAGEPFVHALHPSFAGWVRLGQKEARVAVELTIDMKDSSGERVPLESISELRWEHSPREVEPRLTFPRGNSPLQDHLLDWQGLRWTSNPLGWFIAGYGPHRRLTGHSADAQRLMQGPSWLASLASLFREDASLVEGVAWLRELHLRRLERKPGSDQLLQGMLTLLNDGLLPDDTRAEAVDSEGLWVNQRGVRLVLGHVSDGYQAVASLVIDLCHQLYRAYQEFLPTQVEGAWQVPYPGVVLIDEVEMHLHPSWHQRIGFWLKQHFPHIQFIVATHSPFVCQAANPKGLIRLSSPGEDRRPEFVSEAVYDIVVNGTVDQAVFSELFGLGR